MNMTQDAWQKALESLVGHHSPAKLRQSSQAMSERYRQSREPFLEKGAHRAAADKRGPSSLEAEGSKTGKGTIATSQAAPKFALSGEEEYLAYLAVRQPATFAALNQVLGELARCLPTGHLFNRLVDVGSGPGTSFWAVSERFKWVSALAIESQRPWQSIAHKLWQHHPETTSLPIQWMQSAVEQVKPDQLKADLLIASYSLNELEPKALELVLDRLWQSCEGVFVWVEPGRLDCFDKMLPFRQKMLNDSEAQILAPCTGSGACPYSSWHTLPEQGPGWCHFSARLNRSRLHREIKEATLGYEDEKFSYLIVAKKSFLAQLPAKPIQAGSLRVMEDPKVRRGHVRLMLCNSEEINEQVVAKSAGEVYRRAKEMRWSSIWNG